MKCITAFLLLLGFASFAAASTQDWFQINSQCSDSGCTVFTGAKISFAPNACSGRTNCTAGRADGSYVSVTCVDSSISNPIPSTIPNNWIAFSFWKKSDLTCLGLPSTFHYAPNGACIDFGGLYFKLTSDCGPESQVYLYYYLTNTCTGSPTLTYSVLNTKNCSLTAGSAKSDGIGFCQTAAPGAVPMASGSPPTSTSPSTTTPETNLIDTPAKKSSVESLSISAVAASCLGAIAALF